MNEVHSTDRYDRSAAARPAVAVALAAALALAAGCGSGKNSVAGKVTLNGTPVKGGVVTFIAGNTVKVANINDDGEYLLDDPPEGSARVTVQSLSTQVPMPMGVPRGVRDSRLPPPAAASQPLPRKYASPDNGLAVEVTRGRQKFDIALTP
jgi:hypothetical protein